MKVENRNAASVAGLRRAKGASRAAANGPAPSSNQASQDHVEISTSSRYLGAVQASGEALAARHASKVAALATDVSAGRYQVDGHAVSDRIIQEHLQAA